MTKLNRIDEFEAKLTQNLRQVGIETLNDLLNAGKTVEDRKALAAKVRVTTRTITRWVTVADLVRVNGIQCKYAKLLQVVGIHSIQDLAQAEPNQLHTQLEIANHHGRKYVSRVPAVSRLVNWIEIAKSTDIMMESAPMKPVHNFSSNAYVGI